MLKNNKTVISHFSLGPLFLNFLDPTLNMINPEETLRHVSLLQHSRPRFSLNKAM